MRNLLCWVRDTYGNPKVFITENGISGKGLNQDEDAFIKIRYHYVNKLLLIIEPIFIFYTCIIIMHII